MSQIASKTSLFTKNLITSNLISAPRRQKSFANWYRSMWKPRTNEPPYNHLVQIGDPVLRQKADPVPEDLIKTKEINFLIQNMINVLRKYELVGIAAPQIGISLRVILMEFSDAKRDNFKKEVYDARQMSPLPLTVFINPELKVTNFNKKTFVEGCGSVRGYSGEVARYEEVEVSGFDETGTHRSMVLKGWNARIAQHEIDHINGQVYTDIMDRKTFACSCWETVNSKEGRIEIRFCP